MLSETGVWPLIALVVWAIVATILAGTALAIVVVYRGSMQAQTIAFREQLRVMANIQQHGRPELPAVEIAVREETEPVVSRVTEETVQRGVVAMRAEYARIGVPVSDEELRDEVTSMLLGVAKRPEDIPHILHVRD